MVRLPRKLKKRLRSKKFVKQRTVEALRLASMACGNAAAAMNTYMTALSSYRIANQHLKEFTLHHNGNKQN